MSSASYAPSIRGLLIALVIFAALALLVYMYTVFYRPANDTTDSAQCLLQQKPKTYEVCKDVRYKDNCGDCDECGWCAFTDSSGWCVPGGAAGPYDKGLADQCIAYWYRGRCMWGDKCPSSSAAAPVGGRWWWDWGFGSLHSNRTTVVVNPPLVWGDSTSRGGDVPSEES